MVFGGVGLGTVVVAFLPPLFFPVGRELLRALAIAICVWSISGRTAPARAAGCMIGD